MKLGIVGHEAAKFTPRTKAAALQAIRDAIERHEARAVVSGHSPLGGIDLWAEEVAAELRVPTLIHAPMRRMWEGPGGFRERNLQIAYDSDLVCCIVVEVLPPDYEGMRFPGCYHCGDNNPPHVKSGGCWTAWRCKRREWVIIP